MFDEFMKLSWDCGDFEAIGLIRLLIEKQKVIYQKVTMIRWVWELLREIIYRKSTHCIGPWQLAHLICFTVILLLENAEFRQELGEVFQEQVAFVIHFCTFRSLVQQVVEIDESIDLVFTHDCV